MIEQLIEVQPFLNMLTAGAAAFAALFICAISLQAAARSLKIEAIFGWVSVLLLGFAGFVYYALMLKLSAYVIFATGIICLCFAAYRDTEKKLDYLFFSAIGLLLIGSGVAFYYWLGIVSGTLTLIDAITILRPVGVHRDLALMLSAAALHRNAHIFLRLKKMHVLLKSLEPKD